MVEAAERYREAHPKQSMSSSGWDPVLANALIAVGQYSPRGRGDGRRGWRGRSFGSGIPYHGGQPRGGGVGNQGLEQKVQGDVQGWNQVASQVPGSGRGRGRPVSRGVCFMCGDSSHHRPDCPQKQGVGGAGSSVSQGCNTEPKKANASVSLAGLSAAGPLPACVDTCAGTVKGVDALIMLDSGSETAGVRKSLVRDDHAVC